MVRASSRDDRAHHFIERDEAGRVALPEQKQGERRGQPLHVGELGRTVSRIAGPGHGAADVDHEHGAEIGLLLKLLHVQPVVAAQQLPVDVAQLVTRLVHPVLGELHREPPPGRAVQAGEKAFDHPFGQQFQAGQAERPRRGSSRSSRRGDGWGRGAVMGAATYRDGAVEVNATSPCPHGQDMPSRARNRAHDLNHLMTRRKLRDCAKLAYPLPFRAVSLRSVHPEVPCTP